MSIARTDSSNESVRSVPAAGRDLVLAHHGGDPDAFDDIVRRYYPPLIAHARRRLFDDRLAEDAVQETFLKAYRALPGFAGEYQLGGWLHRILSNVCNDEGARRSRETQANERWAALVEPQSAGPEEFGEREEVRARVAAAVDELPANYREALVLRDVMDYEYADVAVAAGISEDNARARVSRARAALRRLVEGSVALGGAFVGGFKRAGRWVPKLSYHLSNSAGVTDAAVAGTRTGPMITLATTGVAAAAVVVASAVPLLGSSSLPTPKPSAPSYTVEAGVQPPSTSVGPGGGGSTTGGSPAGAAVTATQAGVALLGAGASTTKAPTTTSVAVSTTLAAPTTVGRTTMAPAPYIAPAAVTTLSGSVAVGSGGGSTEGPGELVLDGGSPIEGNLALQVGLPAAGTSICSGYLAIRFLWPAVIGARPAQLTATTTFVGVQAGATSTTYDVVGAGEVSGDNQQLDNNVTLRGQLVVPDTGAGTASFTVTGGTGSAASCEGGTAPTTVPPTTLAPVTVPPVTVPSATVPPVLASDPTTTASPTTTSAPTTTKGH